MEAQALPAGSTHLFERTGRRVTKAPVLVLILGVVLGGVDGSAQVESRAAAVTLVARLPETFALFPAPVPATEPDPEKPPSGAQTLLVVFNWRLSHGRSFQVAYDLAEDSEGQSAASFSGVVVPSRVSAQPPISSFAPTIPARPGPLGIWGNKETDPSGAAGLLMAIPPIEQALTPTLRLRAIIL